MNAIFSPQLGQAVLFEHDKLLGWASAAEYERTEQPLAIATRWMAGLSDLCFIDDCSVEEVRDRLVHEELHRSMLSLFAIVFDSRLTRQTRAMAGEDLEQMFVEKPEYEAMFSSMLFSRPMPSGTKFEEVEQLLGDSIVPRLSVLIDTIAKNQPQIEKTHDAWQKATAHLRPAESAEFQEMASKERLFSRVCAGVSRDELAVLQIEVLESPRFRGLSGYRDVIQQFISELRRPAVSNPKLMIEEPMAPDLRAKKRRPFVRSIPLAELSDRKERQKFAIIYQLKRGRHSLVDRFTRELIQFQRIHDRGTEYVAMSLCHLAVQAKRMGLFPAQLAFTRLALENSPEDAWSWSQHADALARNRYFGEAFHACRMAMSLGNVAVGRAVEAGILKTLLRFDEALAIYESLLEKNPKNIVLRNARAETFKAMGRLNDALEIYDDTIVQFPRDIITYSGRADVLKVLGRYSDALRAYDAMIRQRTSEKNGSHELSEDDQEELLFADDVGLQRLRSARGGVLKVMGKLDEALGVFSNLRIEDPYYYSAAAGMGSVLKAFGRYEEALAAYNEALNIVPTDVMTRNARASLYVLMGRQNEALADLPDQQCITVSDWISLHIRGMACLKQGDISAATRIFEEGVLVSLPRTIGEYFHSALAMCKLRRRQFSQALSTVSEISLPEAAVGANIIKVHVFGEAGRIRECQIALDGFRHHLNPIVREVADELRVRYVSRRSRRRGDEWLWDKEIRLLSAA